MPRHHSHLNSSIVVLSSPLTSGFLQEDKTLRKPTVVCFHQLIFLMFTNNANEVNEKYLMLLNALSLLCFCVHNKCLVLVLKKDQISQTLSFNTMLMM